MTVDVERLVSAWLREQEEITDLVGDRVYTDHPRQGTYPLIVLTLIGGAPVFDRPLYLDQAALQFDCYGGPKVLARQIADVTRFVLSTRLAGTHDAGVVTSVSFGQLYYLPDIDFDAPKPRYVLDVDVYTHP